jgi:hypothetical protein
MDRPEWVHCISHNMNGGRRSWCGGDDRPFFTDIDHAALHGEQGGRLVACRECVAAITKALVNGHDDLEYQDGSPCVKLKDVVVVTFKDKA